ICMARRPKACASFPQTGHAAVSLRKAFGSAMTLISALRRLFDMARLAERGMERDGHANKTATNWPGPNTLVRISDRRGHSESVDGAIPGPLSGRTGEPCEPDVHTSPHDG